MRRMRLRIAVCLVPALLLLLAGCAGDTTQEGPAVDASAGTEDYTGPMSGLRGEKRAVERAENMFRRLGGQKAWAGLESLAILAKYQKRGVEGSQFKQIWRDLDELRLHVQEASDDGGKRVRVIDGERGWIEESGEVREMDPELLRAARFDEQRDLNRVLHRLAKKDDFYLRLDDERRLLVLGEDEALVLWLELDEMDRPFRFGAKPGETRTEVTKWATSSSITHPRASGPPDGSWTFISQRWEANKPSEDGMFRPKS